MLPVMPAWGRYVIAGVIAAGFAYAFLLLNEIEQAEETNDLVLEKQVSVPELDRELLTQAKDETRRDRLQAEKEPLAHLLAESLDVGPSVAVALNVPSAMVPLEDLRRDLEDWRLRWLWYEGELVQLVGPRSGHPIDGYSIYEATVRLAGGDSVIAAFSIPPRGALDDAPIAVGDWVRVEGYLMKLRDTTYPEKLESVPMLVGRSMQRDYEDWGPVTELDQELLGSIDDSSILKGDLAWRDVEDDQTEALWHLGSFARDTAAEWTLDKWRAVEPLSVAEPYERLRRGEVERGGPMRVFGTLIRRRTIAAPPNPANIRFWTSAWIQVSSFGGHLVPVWVPGEVRALPRRVQLEVKGFYYRWYAYETRQNRAYRVPLFIATDLETFDLKADESMETIGSWLGAIALPLLIALLWGQRKASKAALAHSRDLDARRRRRRTKSGAPDSE